MSSIDTRPPFFPRSRNINESSIQEKSKIEKTQRNSTERASDLVKKTSSDAKVSIPEGVRDFSRIKKIATSAPDIDNSEKIQKLKSQIADGTYEIDYEALADEIISSDF